MKRKLIVFVALLSLLFPFIVSCNNSGAEKIYLENNVIIKIGESEFSADILNSVPAGDELVIFTRNYMPEGKYAFTVGGKQKGRTAISVRYTESTDGNTEFDIIGKTENFDEATIPVNGFVLSLPTSMLEGVRSNVGQIIYVEGYDYIANSYERTDLASFYPYDLSFYDTRRINIVNPVNGFEENKIYFLTSEFSGNIPSQQYIKILSLVRSSAYTYTVDSVIESNNIEITGENACMVFTGEYNTAYADNYLKVGKKIMVSSLDKSNCYSDLPCMVYNEEAFIFDDKHTNSDSLDDEGVYLYDQNYFGSVTPASAKERIDIVYADGMVVLVNDENSRSVIPAGNGFVFTFVGANACNTAKMINIADKLDLYLLYCKQLPEKFVQIGSNIFEVDFLDGYRQPEGVCVLYTEAFGKTTGTNEYGTEIVIKDNTVIKVIVGQGNAEIPENGYVLSIHKDNSAYKEAMSVISGSEVKISLTGNDYSVTTFNFDGINTTRYEDQLIIYRNVSKTGTNIYGYEIAVDSDGYAIYGSTEGNITVPTGGFVVSGHGSVKEKLTEVFRLGEKVIIDSAANTVSFINVPELKMLAAKTALEDAENAFEEAVSRYMNINYEYVATKLDYLKSMLEDACDLYNNYDYVKATAYASSVVYTCNELQYSIIETKGVQNRAVWYRSYEKSDEEVIATVEKMKMMNINALYIETWYDGYCIGFIDVEGVEHQAANGDYDALEGFVRICHENGIEVHAWCENFFAGHLLQDNTYSNSLLPLYQDKILLDSQGNGYWDYTNNYGFVFLNPYDRDCRNLVLSVYQELITKYDIDGLHLDYIRFPEYNHGLYDYGYNADILEAFAKETGITDNPRNFSDGSYNQKQWIQFRQNIISSFVEEVFELVRSTNPEIWLSAATYPLQEDAKNRIYQDAQIWCNNGWIDEIFSMTYGADNAYVRENSGLNASMTYGKCFYSAGLSAFGDTEQLSFAWQMTESEQAGADGVALFSLGSINPKTYQNQVINGSFRTSAVQCNLGYDSFIAQMDYINEKLDNIIPISESFKDGNDQFIRDSIAQLRNTACDLKNSSSSHADIVKGLFRLADAVDAVTDDLISYYGAYDDVRSVLSDFEDAAYWATLTASRISAKIN